MVQRVRAVNGSSWILTYLEIIFHPSVVSPDNSSWLSLYIVGISFSISQALILEDTATLSPTWVWHPVAPFILEGESAGGDQGESETSPPGLEAVVALLCNRQDTDAWPFGLENVGTQSQTKSMCVGRRLGLLIARIRE